MFRQPVPYTDIFDLPASVRSHLPEHAQEIYWVAVKHIYVKFEGEWVRK